MSRTGSATKSDNRDKAFVSRYLVERCGLSARDLPEQAGSKMPDFEVFDSGQRLLVAEIKTLHERRPTVEAGWTIRRDEEGMVIAHRPDNAPARIARKIAEAYRQLQDHPHPWAIIIVNRDPLVDARDFLELCSGESIYKGPEGIRVVNTANLQVALGDTLRIRYEVDLYLSIDVAHDSRLGVWWSSAAGEAVARRYFKSTAGVD